MARQHYYLIVASCVVVVIFSIMMMGNQAFSTGTGESGNARGEIQAPRTAASDDLQFSAYRVQSEANGDGNGIVDAGEDITVDITVVNRGPTTYYSVSGNLTEEDDYVEVPGFMAQFGKITNYGGTASGRFRFIVDGACPDKRPLLFNMSLVDNYANKSSFTFVIYVNGTPAYTILQTQFFRYNTDGDSIIEAGETWYLGVTINNSGTALGKNIKIYLDSSSCHVEFYYESIYSRVVSISTLNPGANATVNSNYYWQFTIQKTLPSSSSLPFDLYYNDSISGALESYAFTLTAVPTGSIQSGDGGTSCDAPESFDAAMLILVGTSYPTNSFFSGYDSEDYFKIYLQNGHTYTIKMVEDSSSSDFEITLYSPSRYSVKSDSSTSTTTTFTYEATMTGYFYMVIFPYTHGTPDTYSLQVTEGTTPDDDYLNVVIPVVIGVIAIIIVSALVTYAAKKTKPRAPTTKWNENRIGSQLSVPKSSVVERPYPPAGPKSSSKAPAPDPSRKSPAVSPKSPALSPIPRLNNPMTPIPGYLEESIQIQRTVNPIGSRLRFEISLENRSSENLNRVTLDLDIPAELRWDLENPLDIERTGSTLVISHLDTWERKKIAINLTPTGNVDAYLGAILHVTDKSGQVHDIPMKPKLVVYPRK